MDADNGNKQSETDRWLDSALKARIEAEPRMGLEERVLARLAAQPEPKPFTLWPVLMAAAALLVIAVALVIMHSAARKAPELVKLPQQNPGLSISSQPASEDGKVAPGVATSSQQHLRASKTPDGGIRRSVRTASLVTRRPEALPKLATFPAPRPESREERLLAQMGKQPDSYRQASVLIGASLKDLSIPDVEIDPLETNNSPQQ